MFVPGASTDGEAKGVGVLRGTRRYSFLSRSHSEDLNLLGREHGELANASPSASFEGHCHCCGSCCQRLGSHFWFGAVCLAYILVSSLPRLLVIADLTMCVLVYTCSLPAGSSLSSFVMSDVFEFSFRSSAADVVLLSLVRCVILFRCFAYRYQTSTASLFTSRCVSGISLLYLAFKLAFAASALRLLLVSEGALVLTQLVVYWLVRRRRIEAPSQRRFGLPEHYESIASSPSSSSVLAFRRVRASGQVPSDSLEEVDSEFMSVGGVMVHYRLQRHPSSHVVILLLHGFAAGLFSFRQVWARLAKHATVLAFDRPGFGLSSHQTEDSAPPQQSTFSASFSAELSLQLLQQLSLSSSRLLLVAHSSGASLAALLAARLPERVLGVVLVSLSEGLPNFLRSIFKTKLGHAVILQLARSELGEVTLRRSWHDIDRVPRSVLRNYRLSLSRPDWLSSLPLMVDAGATDPPLKDLLKQVKCALALVSGDDDKLVSAGEAERVAHSLPLATRIVLPSCGHLPHEEQPQAFADVVLNFLRIVSAPPSEVPGSSSSNSRST